MLKNPPLFLPAWLGAFLLMLAGQAHAIEEPKFTVTLKTEVFEVRSYEPYAVAEVVVPGPEAEAGSQGFALLGAYIFGKNKGERKLDMTAPVTQKPAPIKLEMTAPVTQSPAAAGGYLVQFVMPLGSTLASLPEPVDPRVTLKNVAPQQMAVIRYSGTWSQANYDEQLSRLRMAVAQAGMQTKGEPVFSRYDPPFMPWFLRRNEIWLPVLISK